MALPSTIERGCSVLGYPAISRRLVNRYADGYDLDVAPSARVSMGCLLRGSVELGPRVRLSRGCVCSGDVAVGRGTNFEPRCELVGEVEVGRYCAIARRSAFQQTNHETSKPSLQMRLYEEVLDSGLETSDKGPIEVGNDVWIGMRSMVLSGVTVGDGAVVGAGSVVTDDVEPYAVVAGVPARRIGWRFPRDVREALADLAWWEWDEETMRERAEFFEREVQTVEDLSRIEALLDEEAERDRGARIWISS